MPVYRESSPRAVVLLCVAFIAFGVNWWREGVAAIHSGGAMGIWAVVRQARRPR